MHKKEMVYLAFSGSKSRSKTDFFLMGKNKNVETKLIREDNVEGLGCFSFLSGGLGTKKVFIIFRSIFRVFDRIYTVI